MPKVKCEICGITTARVDNQKRQFMAQFPLDEDRCKQWVRVTGKEDLAYVPIEKLHQLKHICGNHFRPKDFSKKKTQLRKKAVPSIGITVEPLSDEILKGFPLHIATSVKQQDTLQIDDIGFKDNNKDAPPSKKRKPNSKEDEKPTQSKPTELKAALGQNAAIAQNAAIGKNAAIGLNALIEQSDKDENAPDIDFGCASPSHTDNPDSDPEPEPGPFSWQKPLPICIENEDFKSDNFQSAKEIPLVDLDVENKANSVNENTEVPSKHEEDEVEKYVSEKHAEFSCDHCMGEIIGFRYTCVQCENFDLCRACETTLVHPHHYMLRVPRPRPFNEIRSVIAAIRVQLKLLEEAFNRNSDEWADVMIKKEEDPLDVQDTVQHPAPLPPLEESVVPIAEINDSQQADEQDPPYSPSTSVAQSSIPIGKTISKKNILFVQKRLLDNNPILIRKVKTNVNIKHAQQKDVTKSPVKYVKQSTAITNKNIIVEKTSQDISNKNERFLKETAHRDLVIIQQKQCIPKTDIKKYFKKESTVLGSKEISLHDTAKQNVSLQKSVANTNVLEKSKDDSNENEVFEEYHDEVWLDEAILSEENQKDKVIRATVNEETDPKQKAVYIDKNINTQRRGRTRDINIRTRASMKTLNILNYKMHKQL